MTDQLIWAFDIGSRSIGWAVMKAHDAESRFQPTGEVVDTGVVIHSGGVLDDSKGTTRHAVRGMVVRSRRRLKRKKTRRRTLKAELAGLGFELQDGWRLRNPWWARSVLAAGPVEDPARVRHLISIALPHMSKHRGWRNPWLKSPKPLDLIDPEDDRVQKLLEQVAEAAADLSEMSLEPVPPTLGAVSWALMSQDGPTKIRQSSKDPGESQRNLNEWVPKVMQEHIASELATIWQVQRVKHPDLFTDESLIQLCKAILLQEEPGVPLDRIGKCDLDNRFYRAPKASPAFQRYRLLDVASNLRVKPRQGDKERLTIDQRDLVIDLLDRGEQISWAEIEEQLDLGTGKLVHADREGTAGRPPINVISERLESVKGIAKLRKWWEKATPIEQEALIAMALSDRSFAFEEDSVAQAVAKDIQDQGLLELVEKFGRSLPPGRASYSRHVLGDLSREMEEGADLHDAIARTYGHGAAAAQEKWDDPVPNNGVELSMKEVRQLIAKLEAEYGTPAVIAVEVVREATLSHSDRVENNRRIQRQRDAREETRNLLMTDFGIDKPSHGVITKQEHITAQAGLCLYCGDKLLLPTTELDHIVPRRTGGATVFNNLAAACPDCNRTKGNRPFGRWCEDTGEAGEKRMEETLARLENLTGPRWKATPAKPFINSETGKWVHSELDLAKRDYRRRLKKTDWDREFDDAEIHSTAFVSRAITERLKVRYPETRVDVFRGGFTAALRNETKLSSHLGLGARKDRSDRRHHAMDAIAVALLTDATWAARVRRRNEAFQNAKLEIRGSAEKLTETRANAPIDDLLEIMPTVEATGGPLIDRMVPVLPRRLSTTGRIHEDTVRPWGSKRVGEAWKSTEISSVRDPLEAAALWRLSSSGGSLKADSSRVLELEDGRRIHADQDLTCAIKYDDKGKGTPVATWMPVRHGWAKTDEIHHARLIKAVWIEQGKTKEAALMVPVSTADVYAATDPMVTSLNIEMVCSRSHPKLARILAVDPHANVERVASITQGDVIDVDDDLWVVTTFDPVANNAHCRPALRGGPASEGLRTAFPASKFLRGKVKVARSGSHPGIDEPSDD